MNTFGSKSRTIIYITLCFQAQLVLAQRPQNMANNLTLQTCITKAISNNLQVKQGKLQIETNQNNWQVSKLNLYPNLNSSFSQYFTAGRNIDPFTNQYTKQQINYQNIGLNSNTLIFGGNLLRNTIKVSEMEVSMAEKDQKVTEEVLTLSIIAAFFQVLNNEDQLDIARKQLESSKFQQKRIENLVIEGISSKVILLDLLAQIAGDELLVVNAENAIEIAKTYLLQTMNERNLDNIVLDRKGIVLPIIDAHKESLNRIIEASAGTQAIISVAKLRTEIAKKNIEIASASRLPTVSLSLGLGTNYSSAAPSQQFISDGKPPKFVENKLQDYVLVNGQKQNIVGISEVPSGSFSDFGYFNQLSFNFNKLLGFNVKIPIFNAYTAKYKIENAKIAKLSADYQKKITEIQVQNTIELAYKNMTAAYKGFVQIGKQLKAVENAFELTKVRFEEGTINSLEFTLAKSNLDKIRLNQVQAKYDYIYRTKVLDFYLGRF